MPRKTIKKKPVAKRKASAKKTPRTRKPEDMSLEEWQRALRREFGREQDFTYKNLGSAPVFSDFSVSNPASGRSYRVAIRGLEPGANFCACPDFTVNTLGTCKHIEWLLAKLEKKRGAKKAFAEGFHPEYSSVYVEYGGQRRVRFRPGSQCPQGILKEAAPYLEDGGYLREDRAVHFDGFLRKAAQSDHEVRVYDDVRVYLARVRDDATRRNAIEKQFGNGHAKRALKKLLKVNLYPYQQQGALFAAKAGRALIADDMGLGKTIQAIAAGEILAKTAGIERVLVICPTALKHQWQQEIERFTQRDAMAIEGLQPTRRELYKAEAFYKITNYDTVHRDLDLINTWRPDLIILDEAQRIKNWNTRRAKAVKQLESDYAIVLTGTPLENRLEELHSIMEVVDRFHLGPLFRFRSAHEHTDETGRVIGYKNLDKIKESLTSILIRRRKQDVLNELPERTDKHFFVDMTQAQANIHAENQDTVAKLVMKWRRHGFLSDKDQTRLMIALQYMRMSCNSTFLVDKETDHSTKMDECQLLLQDLLEDPDRKVVIFSQWLGTHELIIRRLNGTGYGYYHGSLSSNERKKVLERFKADADCRVLLCSDSGGVGLNLQMASAVIMMDQPWNPAVLEQRIARVHRLGQHRNVQVYHFISRDTIEHSMLDVLKFKSSMFAGVLDGGQGEVFLGGTKMKKFMESVEKVSGNIPAAGPAQEELRGLDEDAEDTKDAQAPQPVSQVEAWNSLMHAGAEFLGKLGPALQGQHAEGPNLARLIGQNQETGKHELRIPLPDPQTAQQLGALLAGFGEVLKSIGERKN